MDMYREVILDHYKHPHHFGSLPKKSVETTLYNTSCGDTITMQLLIDTKSKKIINIGFTGSGCAISMASASMLTDALIGKTAEKAKKMKTEDIIKMLGTTLTPSRVKCAVLPLEVIQKAMNNTV
jgi:nitrogen fixation NifU-like protein